MNRTNYTQHYSQHKIDECSLIVAKWWPSTWGAGMVRITLQPALAVSVCGTQLQLQKMCHFNEAKTLESNTERPGLYWSMKGKLTCPRAGFLHALLWQLFTPDPSSLVSHSWIPSSHLRRLNSAKALCGRKQSMNEAMGILLHFDSRKFLGNNSVSS